MDDSNSCFPTHTALMPGTTAEAHFAALGGLNSKMNVELREVFDQGHDALHEEKTLGNTNSITAAEAEEEVVDGSMALQRLILRELTHDNTGGGGGGEDERTAEAGEKACPPEGGTSAECGLHGYGIMNGAWNSIKTLYTMPSPSQWRECVKVCANVPRCTAWHKRGRYCDLFTGERATLEKAAGHEISGLMQGSTAGWCDSYIIYFVTRTLENSVINICHKYGYYFSIVFDDSILE